MVDILGTITYGMEGFLIDGPMVRQLNFHASMTSRTAV